MCGSRGVEGVLVLDVGGEVGAVVAAVAFGGEVDAVAGVFGEGTCEALQGGVEVDVRPRSASSPTAQLQVRGRIHRSAQACRILA